jgi:glycosyltransferase involved in cell wall biosynthesis
MKILLVSDYGTLVGGAEAGVSTLRDGLRRRGHDARLFSSCAQPGGNGNIADYQCFGTISRYRTLLQTANPWAFQQLRQVLAEFKPDVVHVKMFLTQLSPLILPLLRKVPSLYHVVWYRPICPLGTKVLPDGKLCTVTAGMACYQNGCLPLRDWLPLMFQMRLHRLWSSAFRAIVANSQAVKDVLVAEGIGPVKVIWNGVPIRPSRPPVLAPPTVAFAGRLVMEKGVEVLIEAFAKVKREVPEARLIIAGEGPEKERLQKLIADLELSSSVTMPGHLDQAEIERWLSRAWVQVVPSRWAEPFGLVAAEAMMAGTAVVASDSGGLREIVQDRQTGLLVPPGDVNKLAQALVQILQDRELAEQMGKAARKVALECFNEETYIDKFVELYQTLDFGGVRTPAVQRQTAVPRR